jgi:hypothetical protein
MTRVQNAEAEQGSFVFVRQGTRDKRQEIFLPSLVSCLLVYFLLVEQ